MISQESLARLENDKSITGAVKHGRRVRGTVGHPCRYALVDPLCDALEVANERQAFSMLAFGHNNGAA